jgi:hypothetical protein
MYDGSLFLLVTAALSMKAKTMMAEDFEITPFMASAADLRERVTHTHITIHHNRS